ncbi:LPS translocon maturation chaperone LptM [Thalassotalea fusca]
MRKQFYYLLTSFVALLLFSGCGTKGPLYETPPTPEQKQQVEALKTESASKKD